MKLYINDIDVTEKVPAIRRCIHTMGLNGKADSLKIISQDSGTWSRWNLSQADSIRVMEGAADTGRMHLISHGVVNGSYRLTASSLPLTAYRPIGGRVWENVTLIQLVSDMAKELQMTAAFYDIENRVFSYLSLGEKEPPMRFLSRLCMREGLGLTVFDGAVVLFDEILRDTSNPTAELWVDDNSPCRIQERPQNYGSCLYTNGSVTDRYLMNAALPELIVSEPGVILSSADARRYARNHLFHENKENVTGCLYSGELLQDYAPGSILQLSGGDIGAWSGKIAVTGVRHDYTKRTSKLFFRRCLTYR